MATKDRPIFEVRVHDPKDATRRFWLIAFAAASVDEAKDVAARSWPHWAGMMQVRQQGPGVDQKWYPVPGVRAATLLK